MRITGGTLCGRSVRVPDGIIRPAMDRMRESVFAILGDLQGKSFLDIFSGSGIIALEAASRGASPVEAVEMDQLKHTTLLENVSIAPIRIQCRFMPAELYVKRGKKAFDIIFLDPPFPYKFKKNLLISVSESKLVKDATLVIIHRPKQDDSGDIINKMHRRESRKYGRSIVDFYVVDSEAMSSKLSSVTFS